MDKLIKAIFTLSLAFQLLLGCSFVKNGRSKGMTSANFTNPSPVLYTTQAPISSNDLSVKPKPELSCKLIDEDHAIFLGDAAYLYSKFSMYDKTLNIAKQLRHTKLESSLLADISIELGRRGEFNKSVRLVRQIEDPRARARVFLNLAQDYSKAGYIDEAYHSFLKAEKIYENLGGIPDSSSNLYIFNQIVDAELKIRNIENVNEIFSQSLKVSEKLHDQFYKASLISSLAIKYAKYHYQDQASKLFAQALKISMSTKTAVETSKFPLELDPLITTATAYAGLGSYSQFSQTISSIEASNHKTMALIQGSFLASLEGKRDKIPGFLEQAFYLSGKSLDDHAEDGRIIGFDIDIYARSKLLDKLISAYVQTGLTELGIQKIETLKNDSVKAWMLAEIASESTSANRSIDELFLESLHLIEKQKVIGANKIASWIHLAELYSNSKRYKEASNALNKATQDLEAKNLDKRFRAMALIETADDYELLGQESKVISSLYLSFKVAQTIGNVDVEFAILRQISMCFKVLGENEKLLEVTKEIRDVSRRDKLIENLKCLDVNT